MTFATLGISEPIERSLNEKGYTTPSEIQRQAIPAILARKDMMAAAQTGSGKTGAFLLPLLQMLSLSNTPVRSNSVKVLILTPTRELAAQVCESADVYGKHLGLRFAAVFGGVKINPQMMRLRSGVDILVATPGRLMDLFGQNAVRFDQVETLVLDEADRMLDMGFINDIEKIMRLLPKKRQNLLFSATFSPEIRRLAKGILNQPIEIDASPRNATAETIKQVVYTVSKSQKASLLTRLIVDRSWFQVLVFSRTKHGANRIVEKLLRDGISALAIHGNKSQAARTKALGNFKKGLIQVLVATDIAARGLDIAELPHVVNYDLPNVPEDYVHRIGRTGRAGREGEACSLVSQDEMSFLRDIQRLIKSEIPVIHNAGYADLESVAVVEREPLERTSSSRPRTPKPSGPRSETPSRPRIQGARGQRSGDAPRPRSDGSSHEARSPRSDSAPKPRSFDARSPRADGDAQRPRSYESRSPRSDSAPQKPRSFDARSPRADGDAQRPRSYESRSPRSDSAPQKPRSFDARSPRTDSATQRPRSYESRPSRTDSAPQKPRSFDARRPRVDGDAQKPRSYEGRTSRSDGAPQKPRSYDARPSRTEGTLQKPRTFDARRPRVDGNVQSPRSYAARPSRTDGASQKPRSFDARSPRSDGDAQRPRSYEARPSRTDGAPQKPRTFDARRPRPDSAPQKPRSYETRPPRGDGPTGKPRPYTAGSERSDAARKPRANFTGAKRPSGPRKPRS